MHWLQVGKLKPSSEAAISKYEDFLIASNTQNLKQQSGTKEEMHASLNLSCDSWSSKQCNPGPTRNSWLCIFVFNSFQLSISWYVGETIRK